MAGEALDLLLRGARVIDPETGLDGIRDVGVRRGRIEAITTPGALEGPGAAPQDSVRIGAAEQLDLTGLVLAPGFIDLHSHAQSINGLRLQALDGVTTSLDLEAGALPVAPAYERAAAEGRPINYGYAANWLLARILEVENLPDPEPGSFRRQSAVGLAALQGLTAWQEPAPPEAVSAVLERLRNGVAEGGIGFGVLVGYSPGSGRVEMYRLAELAAELNVPMFVHGRYKEADDPLSAVEGALELIALATATGAPVHLCHVNSTYALAEDLVLDAIAQAQDRGARLTTEAYPYHASSTSIGASFLSPEQMSSRGKPASSIRYLATGERVASYERLAELRATDPGGTVVIDYLDPEDPEQMGRLHRILTFPGTAVASDAMLPQIGGRRTGADLEQEWPLPDEAFEHPRSAGCFTRVLGHISRELGLMSLNSAIERASYLPATILEGCVPAMRRKGRVQVGCDADLTIFDPATVTDRATFEDLQPAAGISHVLVGGQFVVRDGRLDPAAMPGAPVLSGAPVLAGAPAKWGAL
ncbi:amidohydrolase family protein [Bogoriella caseilytica]|uniref:N-acyl-D-aspartate/D-glutamate deacylase n=1 Tax=Bogoriella caseilytica TaxID=56055 RepID=A0A3N2BDP0_9MICO|nr:amidohydrolase family protein [Bogoriella caseilytica]ROR73373.1 N-acyl-D-aspartate/D-glutamate deacylase [Bogoriella caseilytica]